jgi:SAM-dependent methyltransferase
MKPGWEQEPTTRFSSRADDYAKYRPSYPKEMFDFLFKEGILAEGMKAADVGSGTGIFSKLLLDRALEVYGIEPNAEMRHYAERDLGSRNGFHSLQATSEDTMLPDKSVEAITAAQAFHWFEPSATGKEFRRILKPGGHVILVWNTRLLEETPLAKEYEGLVAKYRKGYSEVEDKQSKPEAFLGERHHLVKFRNEQVLDFEGMVGRVCSASYMPHRGDEAFPAMLAELEEMFRKYNDNGMVLLPMETECHYGTLE